MNWLEKDNALHAEFKFKNFKEAFTFMTEIAFEAEAINHHPTWTNVWNTVSISLNTHDAGNIVTQKDTKLAKMIDEIYARYKD